MAPVMKTLLLSLVVLAVLAPATSAAAEDGGLVCRTDPYLMDWDHMRSVKAPGAPVRFWFDGRKGADRKRAKSYAKETGKTIWPALRRLTGRKPLTDAKLPCRHGGDGALDVYVFRGEIEDLTKAQAATVPYDVQQSCTVHAPQLILMRPGLSRSKLVHELFHAFTSAYARKNKDCEVYGPWDEAMATWAMDFVYPKDQVEHEQRFDFDRPQYPVHAGGGYGGWAFLRYLTATQGGSKVIRSILEAEEAKAPVRMDIDPVVDGAIPGGFDKRIPEYALYAWNAKPQPVSPITASFKQWDRWDAVPMIGDKKPFQPTPQVDVALDGPVRTDRLQRKQTGINSLGREYFHYRFGDDAVRRVLVRNPMAGTAGYHFNGFALIDGRWQVVDWSGDATKSFCRDNPGEDVEELVLVVSNSLIKAMDGTRPEIESSSTCGMSFRVTGYRVTQRTQTDLGWRTQDDQLAGLAPVSSILSKVPGESDPEFDETRTVCEFGAVCEVRLLAPTTRTTDGEIGGPNPADDDCPYRYGVRTWGPFAPRSVAQMEIDTTAGDPKVTVVDSIGPLEVGDATENMCGGNSHGYADVEVRTPLDWNELLSGRPVTVQYDRTGTEPTAKGSHSATIGWSQGGTFTLQRVNPDGTPYLP